MAIARAGPLLLRSRCRSRLCPRRSLLQSLCANVSIAGASRPIRALLYFYSYVSPIDM